MVAGTAQGRDGKCQRIEFLIIPQLGEVKTDGGGLPVLVLFDAVKQPAEAGTARVQGSGFRVQGNGREETFNGEGGFFDARF